MVCHIVVIDIYEKQNVFLGGKQIGKLWSDMNYLYIEKEISQGIYCKKSNRVAA